MKAVAVIGSAAFVGVMLTIGVGLGAFFILSDPGVFEQWFADYFVFLVLPVFMTSVPAFVGTIAMLRRSEKGSPARSLWRVALIGLVVSYAITAVIHLPLNIAFWSFTLSDDDITRNLAIWMIAHVARIVAALIGATYAYRAVVGSTATTAA